MVVSNLNPEAQSFFPANRYKQIPPSSFPPLYNLGTKPPTFSSPTLGATTTAHQQRRKERKKPLAGCVRRYSRRSERGGGGSKSRLQTVPPVKEDGEHTTVMIKNIPNRYTRDMLMEFLDDHCKMQNSNSMDLTTVVSAYDFLYLPMDFRNCANKGYAFVNFTDPKAVWKFYLATHNKTWDLFSSSKIRQITYARIQGKEELVRHFEGSKFHCEVDAYLPVCFSPPRDGSRDSVVERIVGKRVW